MYNKFKLIIITIILIFGGNLSSVSFQSIDAQSNYNNFKSIQLIMGPGMLQRGNIAMGFDQNKIRHNFTETASGGKITITSLSANDASTINQIREHIKNIQNDFSNGNFTRPFFIHAQEVPGTKIMSEKKDLIKYSINELTNGSELVLNTTDKDLVYAIHQFIEYQNNAHQDHD